MNKSNGIPAKLVRHLPIDFDQESSAEKYLYVWITAYYDLYYISFMKKIIIMLCILMPTGISGQFIDPCHFNEEKMNDVLFMKMNEFTEAHYSYPLFWEDNGSRMIYRLIRKNNEKMDFDDLTLKINTQLQKRYDTTVLSRANLVGSVGLICCISSKDFNTYQDIATRCIEEWSTSENLIFMKWGQIGNAISYFNNRTEMVYLFFGFYNY